MTFEVQTWGGIGDILREISLLPVSWLHRRFGIRAAIRHSPQHADQFHPAASCPSAKFVEDIVRRLPACVWCGEGVSPRASKALSRLFRRAMEVLPSMNRLYSPGVQWKAEDQLPFPLVHGGFHIVIQTHLEGLPCKKWPVDHWRYVLREIQTLVPHAYLHVLDPAGGSLTNDRILVHDQLSFPQALRLVSAASFVVSVDSWTKYVAGWHDIPQLVIIPDQTSDYPQLTAESVWRHSFRGLRDPSTLWLCGLAPRADGGAIYTGGRMETFAPELVFQEARKALFSVSRKSETTVLKERTH